MMTSIFAMLRKIAMPCVRTMDNESVDFMVEKLDRRSFDNMMKDLRAGKTITILKDDWSDEKIQVNLFDFKGKESDILIRLESFYRKRSDIEPTMRYNSINLRYERI